MATLYTDIYDLFLTEITDYKLDKLYSQSVADFEVYLQGFLIRSLPKFYNCTKDLTDRDDDDGTFTETLTTTEKDILATLMAIQWLKKEIQNVSQINVHLTDKNFKHYAEGQNLKEKSEYMNRLREIVNQDMAEYGIKNIPWSEWKVGEFGI